MKVVDQTMFGTYIGNDQMLVKTAYNGMLKVSSKDMSLMPILVSTGAMEVPLTKFLIKLIKPGMKVVDIGANIGYFTVLLGMLIGDNGKVYGFEANKEVFKTLKDNLEINWISHRAIIHDKAVYSENKKIRFHKNDFFQGDSSIHSRIDSDKDIYYNVQDIEVEAVILNDVLKEVDSIDLLKIDIEGGEYHAFLGMTDLFEQKKIKMVTFEWNKSALGSDAPLFVDTLKKLSQDYHARFFLLNEEGELIPTEIEVITNSDFYPFAIIQF